METKELSHSEEQAKAQLSSIIEMVAELTTARDAEDIEGSERAEQTIHEDPLSVQVRSGWHNVGEEAADAEFEILLCTGGPAVRLVGELSEHGEPENVRIEHQDWGTPWTEYRVNSDEANVLLTYASQFYFGQ